MQAESISVWHATDVRLATLSRHLLLPPGRKMGAWVARWVASGW